MRIGYTKKASLKITSEILKEKLKDKQRRRMVEAPKYKDIFETEIDDMNLHKNAGFEDSLRKLDEQLRSIKDPELADYLILTTLRDWDDIQCEEQIKIYQLKFGI